MCCYFKSALSEAFTSVISFMRLERWQNFCFSHFWRNLPRQTHSSWKFRNATYRSHVVSSQLFLNDHKRQNREHQMQKLLFARLNAVETCCQDTFRKLTQITDYLAFDLEKWLAPELLRGNTFALLFLRESATPSCSPTTPSSQVKLVCHRLYEANGFPSIEALYRSSNVTPIKYRSCYKSSTIEYKVRVWRWFSTVYVTSNNSISYFYHAHLG